MKLLIRVEAQSKKTEITQLGERCYKIKTTKPAKEGKANADVIAILAEHFKIPKSDVEIISGHRNKEKMIEIYGL